MADLSDFKKGQIVGACIAGASVTKTIELFGVAGSTVLKVTTAFEKEDKNNLLTETKLWKKAKAVWLGPSDFYAHYYEGS